MLIALGTVGCGHGGGDVSTSGPEIVVHDATTSKQERKRVEAYWIGTGIADVAHGDATSDAVQPE
ncbi:hypothetical protein [Streptomyces sp. NPDC059398]|uniref:hypothetical protein n=1 Tax=Streptomyces sp. NPDC059398 TaxID=3346820 RepID=UPI003695E3C4